MHQQNEIFKTVQLVVDLKCEYVDLIEEFVLSSTQLKCSVFDFRFSINSVLPHQHM